MQPAGHNRIYTTLTDTTIQSFDVSVYVIDPAA